MGATKTRWRGNQLCFYDGTTYESILPVAPILLYDDFLGGVVNTDLWTEVDVGDSTKAISASILTYHLHATDQAEDAGLYGRDDKSFNLDKGPIIEFRAAVHIAPTLDGQILLGITNDSYGVASMRFATADEIAKFAGFGFYTTLGTGLIAGIWTDDGTTDNNAVTTATTMTLDTYNIYRIDFTDITNVKFYIDGVQVATGTTFDISASANVTVQPIAMCMKNSGAGLGDLYLDYIKCWQATR